MELYRCSFKKIHTSITIFIPLLLGFFDEPMNRISRDFFFSILGVEEAEWDEYAESVEASEAESVSSSGSGSPNLLICKSDAALFPIGLAYQRFSFACKGFPF